MITLATGNWATMARCVMCGAAIMRAKSEGVPLCDMPHCRTRHAALPKSQRCGNCDRPLAVAQWAAGHCGDASCREELLLRRPIAASRKAFEDLRALAPKRRNRSAASRGIPPEERESYKVAVLPHIYNRPSALPKGRREAFETHLRANLAKARERLAAGEVPSQAAPINARAPGDNRSDAEREAEFKLLGAGCASCRGFCCQAGGNKAFNDVVTMSRYLQQFPTDDDETIVTRYLSYLAPRTLTNGCVYQHEKGCTLPRELRADVCNRFYCSHLNTIRNEFAAGDPVRAYFVHVEAGRLVGGRFVEIPVVNE